MSLLSKALPILYCDWISAYITIDDDLTVSDITENIGDFSDMPVVVLNGVAFQSFSTVYDLKFFRFLVNNLKKQEEFSLECALIERLFAQDLNKASVMSVERKMLLEMLKVIYNPSVLILLNRYQDYYQTVVKQLYFNVEHFNKQRMYVDSKALVTNRSEAKKDALMFDNNRCYIPLYADCLRSETGRLNSSLYSQLHEFKPYLKADNDVVIEIDTIAAEWRLLLHTCGESDALITDKDYWGGLAKHVGLPDGKLLKSVLYPTLFGAGRKTIAEKGNLDIETVSAIQHSLMNAFPKTFRFSREESKYISPNSSIVYDLYGKEMQVEDNYVKVSYFIQSSLATHFQMFTHSLIKTIEQNGLHSKVLFTIHDSLFVDLKLSEKNLFFDILNSTNSQMSPPFRFTIKK